VFDWPNIVSVMPDVAKTEINKKEANLRIIKKVYDFQINIFSSQQ
jgi:hypothetical protein